jgi:hypothetical protein
VKGSDLDVVRVDLSDIVNCQGELWGIGVKSGGTIGNDQLGDG